MKLICTLFLLLLLAASTTAQQNAGQPSKDDLQRRISQIEAQMELMRQEITELKQIVSAETQTTAKPQTAATVSYQPESEQSKIATASANKSETETQVPSKATDAAKQQPPPKQLGIDIGSARVIPYGTIYFNAFANSGGTNNIDIPTFATTTGTSNASATVRQTRLGIRLEGAKIANARLGAVIEADFFGGFPEIGIGENFGIVRLRLANARLDWEKTSITIGQDWVVFAPNNPVSLATAGNPQLAAAGNPWARMPQFKVETHLNKNVTWQGAILAPQTGDYPSASSPFFLQPTSGATSRVPFFQSRLSFGTKNLFGTKKPGNLGIAAHYGRSQVLTGAASNIKNDVDSVGIAADWDLPLGTSRLTLIGEAFFGRNLGGFQAGIFQGYNSDFAYRNGASLVAGGVRGIETRGGWAQLGFTPDAFKDRLTFYGSAGIDDPRDEDLISTTRRDFRAQNFVYAFDGIYKFTPQFSIGAEIRRFNTLYVFSGRKNASHVNLSAAYSF